MHLRSMLIDRVHGGILGTIAFVAPVDDCLTLGGGTPTGSLCGAAPAAFGLAAGLKPDLGCYLASCYFGVAPFVGIFSGLFVIHLMGYSIVPLATAHVRGTTSSYVAVLGAMIAALPVIALFSAALGSSPARAADG